jgi:uncharacterized protein (DUF885 family)
VTADTAVSASFKNLVDELVRDICRRDPGAASFCGLTEWDHEVADRSATAFERQDEQDRRWLSTFEQVEPAQLTAEERIDRELILARVGEAVANADYLGWRRSLSPYVQDGVFELFVHRARPEPEAVAAAIDRLGHVPDAVAAGRANLSAELAHPRVLRRDLVTVRGEARFLREELPDFVTDPALRERLRRAAEPAAQAFDELAAHVSSLAAIAHGDLTFGERRYNNLLQIGEQLNFDVHSLRELGWSEYRALDAQMADVAERIDGSRDWKALQSELQNQHASDMPALLAEYTDATTRARRFVADRDLLTLPQGERCDVERAPAFLAASVVASYFPAAPFLKGSRGVFNVPFTTDGASAEETDDRLRSNPHHEIPATTVHEAYGGHHGHFVHMANANPLRQFLHSAYFAEGWALYFEKVAYEQGFYRSDDEVLGWLVGRIMRAARIIVDTSLHLGEMSIDDVAEFMRTKAGLPPAVARGEAERYAAFPTQASAYITGAIAIERSRDRWLAEGHGSLREFHDAITDSGCLPPGLAARAIGLPPETATN